MELVCAVTGEDGDVSDLTYVWEKVRDEMDPGTALVSGSRLTISPAGKTNSNRRQHVRFSTDSTSALEPK